MATRTAVTWKNSPDRSAYYSRGIKLSGFSELLVLGRSRGYRPGRENPPP